MLLSRRLMVFHSSAPTLPPIDTSYSYEFGSGDRRALTTAAVSTVGPWFRTQLPQLIDGSSASGYIMGVNTSSYTNNNSLVINFLAPRVITEMTLEQGRAGGDLAGHGTWKVQGSQDGGTTWTDLSVPTEISAGVRYTVFSMAANRTAYSTYRLLHTAGSTTYEGYWAELTFQIDQPPAASPVATSYANTYGSGNRTASITVTKTGPWWRVNPLSMLVDGSSGTPVGMYTTSYTQGNSIILTLPAARVVTEATFELGNNGTSLTDLGTWKLQGSQDGGSTWIDLSLVISMNSRYAVFDCKYNATPYQTYRFLHVGGTIDTNGYFQEITLKISAT